MEEKKDRVRDKLLYLLGMLLLTAAAVYFILLCLRRPKAVEADLSALGRELQEAGLTAGMKEAGEAELKRYYDLLPSDYEELLYFAPETFMEVDELLLIRLPEGGDGEAVKEAVRRRIGHLKQTFENYGTDQYSLMQEAVLYENSPYVCYAAGHRAAEALSLIRSRIER